ncbi:DUF2271 domain-containing protein [Rheinheimera marina]|uniref:DUF2271 domain-containing protein n=1 Tax=Rheinheimera marina TaxID=1774958 RepID=A0ABV9JQN0_9GAMM
MRAFALMLVLGFASQLQAKPYQQPWLDAELVVDVAVPPQQWQQQLPKLQQWLATQQQSYLEPTRVQQQEWQQRCEQLRQQMLNGVSCRLGQATLRWQQAVQTKQLPDRVALRQHSRQLNKLPATDPQIQWNYSGIARAELAQQLTAQLQLLWPDANSFQLKLAGLLWYQGAEQVMQLGETGLQQLRARQLFLAESELTPGYQVAHRTYSAVLNPADGWPVEYGPQATVAAADLVQAWALAQSLAVLAPQQGLQLANQLQSAALLQSEQGQLQASAPWYAMLADPSQQHSQQMQIRYLLPELASDARRPYLSLWLADEQQQLVRQLEVSGAQQRWWQELRHWWRKQARQAPEQFDSLAGATHKAGWQQLRWDGRNLSGEVVPTGRYWLHLEIAREHGGHQHLKWPLDWQPSLAAQQHKISGELSAIEWQLAD